MGHRADPMMATTFQRLQQLRKWAQSESTLQETIERPWTVEQHRGQRPATTNL